VRSGVHARAIVGRYACAFCSGSGHLGRLICKQCTQQRTPHSRASWGDVQDVAPQPSIYQFRHPHRLLLAGCDKSQRECISLKAQVGKHRAVQVKVAELQGARVGARRSSLARCRQQSTDLQRLEQPIKQADGHQHVVVFGVVRTHICNAILLCTCHAHTHLLAICCQLNGCHCVSLCNDRDERHLDFPCGERGRKR
jgi:hypothetical protein